MYRFTTLLSKSHLVLVRKKVSDGSCAALIVMRAPVRQYAKDHFAETCPPPRKVVKSKKFLYGMIGTTLIAGAAIVYAKNSKPTRNWLERNAPWADNIVAIAYQEDESYGEFAMKHASRVKQAITDFLFGKEGRTPLEMPSRVDQDLEADAKKAFDEPKTYQTPKKVLEPLYVVPLPEVKPEVSLEATLVQTEKCEPRPDFKVEITKKDVEYEQEMHKSTRIAVDAYKKAIEMQDEYNKALHRVIEEPSGNPSVYAKLKSVTAERDKWVKAAHEASAAANCSIETMEGLIKANKVKAPASELAMMRRYINDFRRDLSAEHNKLRDVSAKADISQKYWEKIEAARREFCKELETLFPGIDLTAPRLDHKGDMDIFIVHIMNKISSLQTRLAELETVQMQKLDHAIDCNDQKALIELKAYEMLMIKIEQKEKEFQEKVLQIQIEAKKKLREQLQEQYERMLDANNKAILKKETEIANNAQRKVFELLEAESLSYKKELAALTGRLRAIEVTLKQRAAAEQSARRSQSVWAAGEALLAATRRPAPTASVCNEIRALEKAGQGDLLVTKVVMGIPEEAREKGVITEKALKDRFDVLEQTAVKVALVGKNGGSLPLYFLSWLQSKLLFQKFAEIPERELNNEPVDFTEMDTFDIIHRARYFMDHGDLGSAVRYLNLLQGAPRAAAAPWLKAAREHLEVRQVAEAVMAHASLATMLDK